MAVKVLNYEQACVLYDAGVREIAVSGCGFKDTRSYWLVEERAKAGEWEPQFLDAEHRHRASTVHMWTFAVVVEWAGVRKHTRLQRE